MNQSRVTVRYANALLQLSIEQDSLELSYRDMLLVDSVCSECKDLTLLLKSPIIKTDQKLDILKEIFESKLSNISMLFVNIITNKKRESLLAPIAKSFLSQYKAHNNIREATVTTASPISIELRDKVIEYIKRFGESDVELTEIVDEKIIGGSIIRMGDKQLDASVASEVSELRQMFNKNLYLQDF